MRATAVAVIALCLVMFSPTSSSADVDVSPRANMRDPAVLIEGLNLHEPRARLQGDDTHLAPAKAYEPEFFQYVCPLDPDIGQYGCRTYEDEDDDREVTDGDVLRAAREIGLPQLPVTVQPGEQTLVNADTIFSTAPQAFDHSVTLLGFGVDIVATATSYTWHHGDGTSSRTSTAGRPYPAFDVTHRYQRAADSVRPRVDVTYRIRYRVDGGPWRTIDQTVTAAGPAAELDVREAVPVLVKP